jgi:hypothetical protein
MQSETVMPQKIALIPLFYGFLFWADVRLLIALYVELLPQALRRPRDCRGLQFVRE